MSHHRLVLAIAAHRSMGGPVKINEAIRSGGVDHLQKNFEALTPELREVVETEARALAQRGIDVIMPFDEAYPSRLKNARNAPPFLYFSGNLSLLNAPGVGMCGSRNASPEGLEAAGIAGKTVAGVGLTIISGYARGVDMATHAAALEAGGDTVVVLAEGIGHFRMKRALGREVDWSCLLVVSQFPPFQPWMTGAAMARNSLIAALGLALVVIEAGDSGGTLDAGLKGMDLGVPVLALDFRSGPRAGNSILFERGAVRVASTRELVAAIRAVKHQTPAVQLTLLDDKKRA